VLLRLTYLAVTNAFAVLRLRPMEQAAPLRAVPAPITDQ